MDVNQLPENVRDFISDLIFENEALRKRVQELEDELIRKSKNKLQKHKRTNKRDWLESEDEDDEY